MAVLSRDTNQNDFAAIFLSDYVLFTGYLTVGTLDDVITNLGQLILTYPN